MQIKGEKQPTDLISSVEFLTSKFDELEQERKKDELIKSLQIEVSSLKVGVKNVKKADDQEQYSRRNCLLIHGLTETKTEDTDEIVLDAINNKLNIGMSQISIGSSHLGETERSWSKATSYYCKVYKIQR